MDLNDSHSYRSTPLRVADKSDIQICGDLSGSATRGSKKGGIGRSGNIIDRSTRRLESAGQQRTMQQAKSVIKDQPPGLVWLHIGSTDFVLNTSWDWATSACPSASGVNKRAMMKMFNKIMRLTGWRMSHLVHTGSLSSLIPTTVLQSFKAFLFFHLNRLLLCGLQIPFLRTLSGMSCF